ncbi:MAG: hypothetical protein ACK53Y_00085, partial [bacterium]
QSEQTATESRPSQEVRSTAGGYRSRTNSRMRRALQNALYWQRRRLGQRRDGHQYFRRPDRCGTWNTDKILAGEQP